MRGVVSSTPEVLAPVWVLLSQSINAYSTSSVPLTGTFPFRRMAVYKECLRCAGAPRRPTSGSVLSLRVPFRHAALYDRGESVGCLCSVPSPTMRAFTGTRTVRHSRVSPSSASDGTNFRGFTGSLFAAACRVARLLGGSDRVFIPAVRDFYSRAFVESVALLAAGYNYGGN
jgi:hypothetical protein